ncbi:MAG: alpha/beta fold hydrolase [Bauldia sp.]|nr:alpha/beta fold hydrolase [Bauldia sp.]
MAGQDLEVEIVGSGPDLVLLHSLLTDRTSYAALVDRLKNRRRLVLFNMPGFGSSPRAEPLAGYADRIVEAFDALGLPPETDVLGNGLGGFVGLTMALRHGERFNRLVLIGSAIAFPEAGRATFRAMADKAESIGMAPLADAAMLRMFPQDYIDANPAVIEDRKQVFVAIDPQVFAAACRSLAALDLAPDLDRITNPVLVVVGEHDSATGSSLGHELAARLPDGQVIELAGAGHAPHMQAPDALVRAMAPFLGLG